MKKQQKSIFALSIVVAFIAAMFLPGLINAGDLDPTGPPGSTMYTLEEIYDIVWDTNAKLESPGAVERTFQIKTYAPGDDGYWKKGVAWPNPRFTNNGDGTVTDNLTGLIWLENANCFGERFWSDALTDCNSLAAGSCGLTDGSVSDDWRLPNVKELLSLINYGHYGPALPAGHLFTSVMDGIYWTSTTLPPPAANYWAWIVTIFSGYVTDIGHKEQIHYVWPVRGGN